MSTEYEPKILDKLPRARDNKYYRGLLHELQHANKIAQSVINYLKQFVKRDKVMKKSTSIFLVLSIAICTSIFAQLDLVELVNINPNIRLDIRYATDDNFTKKAVYTQAKCFLLKAVADKINLVQQELEKQGLGLKVFDGYRPRSVQYKFWELVPDSRYVGDPKKGSKHNRGSAIDLTIIRLSDGQEVEMPSGFDDFSEKAHRNYSTMAPEASKNCKLLEELMVKQGFIPLPTEWWHFDDADWQKYDLLDISFEELEKQNYK